MGQRWMPRRLSGKDQLDNPDERITCGDVQARR